MTPTSGGRATAIALAGTPVTLSIGVPAGTFLANLVGWRYTFGIMTALTLALIVWIVAIVPDFPGQARMPLRRAATLPGVVPVLAVDLGFVLAHNTYIAPPARRHWSGRPGRQPCFSSSASCRSPVSGSPASSSTATCAHSSSPASP